VAVAAAVGYGMRQLYNYVTEPQTLRTGPSTPAPAEEAAGGSSG
jgi:hypothetical protein